MEAVNGVLDGGPPPPSPLTGCYLLVVIGEPHSQEHKDIILRRVAKGLLSWDSNDCMVDLEKELAIITEQAPEGEEARYGERLIQYASENLVTEILIHPAVSTLSQCVRNLLSSFTRHRHIIHSGYTFAANGSWALQDGTFSLADFSEAFQELDVQRVIRAYDNGISVDIHCSPEGDWTRLPKETFAKNCKARLNPVDVLPSSSPAIADFLNYITPFLVPLDIITALESSEVVGNIRFSHPTLYVFPGGQGDAALFGINGFNMLLDGGFSRKACFWDFVRHLDRLDAVLLTRLNNSNVSGITSVLKRKRQNAVYPQIGHFFCNIQERKALLSPDGDKDRDPLLINLHEEGHDIVTNLKHLHLQPQSCYRDSEPINLYHKVGHGTLDMYVLSPAKDSREVREFIQKWNNNDIRLFANPKTKEFSFPLPNLVSICALLVWQPSNSSQNITRILFPGSTPQNKIFEGLDRLKQLDCIKYPVCSESSLNPPKKSKEQIFDAARMSQKILPDVKKEKSPRLNDLKPKEQPKQIDNKSSETQETKKEIKKSDSTDSDKSAAKPINKTESKPIKTEAKTPRAKDKDSKSVERKPAAISKVDKKPSPTTPKKSLANGDATKPKAKLSPTSTPAKSAKEATNRKVLESKKQAPKKETKAPEKKEPEKKVERKPISRRPKAAAPVAPATKPATGSPIRKKPDSIAKKAKLDKEGTTDSSTVSTPTAEGDVKRDISKLTPEELEQLKAQELADLQEEQEVVQEIEAVFRKGEELDASESEMRQIKNISIEEKTDEEYLVVEKVVVLEDEMQKLTRDSEESEKQRKLSEPKVDEVVKEIVSPEEKIDKVESATQPDEKFSATVESGATTAPTLPEDERIPLDEIKEKDDTQIIEEKHVKEDTKEKESIPTIQLPSKSAESPPAKVPPVVGIRLDKQQHIRDIVKTPDEVADLPMHEVADLYAEYQKTTDEQTANIKEALQKEVEDAKEEVKAVVDEIIDESKDIVDKNNADANRAEEVIENIVQETKDEVNVIAEESKKAVEETVSEVQKTAVDVKEDIVETKHLVDEQIKVDKDKIDETKKEVQKVADEVEKEIDESKQAVDDLVGDIKETRNEISNEINNVVEEKTEDLVETVQEIKDVAVDKVEEAKETIKEVTKIVTDKVEEKVETAKETIEETKDAVVETAKEVKDVVETTTETITEKMQGTKESIKDKFEEVQVTTKETIAEKVEEVKETITEKIEEVKHEAEEIKVTTEKIMTETIHDTQKVISENIEKTKVTVAEKVEDIKETVHNVQKQTETIAEDIKLAKDKAQETINEVIVEETKHVEKVQKTVEETAKDTISKLQQSTEQIKTEIKEEAKSTVDAVQETITETVAKAEVTKEDIKESVTKSTTEIKEQAEELITEAKSEVTKVTEAISETKESVMSEVKETVSEKAEAVGGFFSKTFDKLAETTKTIGDKVTEKVEKVIGEMKTEEKVDTDTEKETIVETAVVIVNAADADMEEHADIINMSPESPCPTPLDIIDKTDLGRKSPKEREQDVAKIVASVAEVLKSEAPLEDFKGKIPLEITTFPTFTPYTTELRETHITTVDSPTVEMPGQITPIKEEKIDEILEEMREDIDSNSNKSKISELIKNSNELLEASSKMISGIKERKEEEGMLEDIDEEKEDKVDTGIVHRMLVTASSEDGGEETVICPPGSITFSKSSESSGRSSPELRKEDQQKQEISSPESSQEQTSVVHKEPEISAKMLSEDIPEKKNKVDEDIKKPEPVEKIQDNKELENKLDAEKIASGKTTPDIKSGKTTPEVASGKTTPDIQKEEKAISGKSTPDLAKDLVSSGKTTPDIKSGKATPDVPATSDAQQVKESLGKSTPEVKEADNKLPSGKSTPALSGKATPEPKVDEKAPSGKATPDVTNGKISPEPPVTKKQELTNSGKASPETGIFTSYETVDDVIKTDPSTTNAEERKQSITTSSVSPKEVESGKSTPDLPKSGKESPLCCRRSDDKSSSPKDISDHLVDGISSGQTTPELNNISGKSTPGPVTSGKTTPDISKSPSPSPKELKRDSINLEKSPILSGKATPDGSKSGKSSPDFGKGDSIKLDTDSLASGKATPDVNPELPSLIAPRQSIQMDTDSLASGKMTPEVDKHSTHIETDSLASGKVTPDVHKFDMSSGKSTPDVCKRDSLIADDKHILSGTATPDIHHEDLPSSKKSSIQIDEKLEIQQISGKSTPDIKDDKSLHIDDKQPSGKSTPDMHKDISSKKTSIQMDEPLSIGKSPSPDVGKGDSLIMDNKSASGKSTPELSSKKSSIQIDEAIVLSGKTTPDVKEAPSGKATPDLKNEVVTTDRKDSIKVDDIKSGKTTPDIHEKEDLPSSRKESMSIETKQLSGKSTPELEAKIKLEADKAVQSGKTTPEHFDMSNGRKDSLPVSDEKKTLVASGKSTPEPSLKDVERKQSIYEDKIISGTEVKDLDNKLPSGKSTPDSDHKTSDKLDDVKELKVESDKVPSSGKATPEVGIKDKVLSGKSTPDLHTDIKRDSIAVEKIPSGKSTPDIGKLETMTIENVQSGKITPDKQSASVHASSGKSTPEPLKQELQSGKSTPLSPDHQNGLSRDSIPSGKSTPGLSGKVTPEPDVSSGKVTPESRDLSGKTTPDLKAEEKQLSGKSTPDSGINGTTVHSLKQETLLTGQQSPDFSKRSSIQAEQIISGKSTPDSTKVTHHYEAHESGKSTPDFGKRSSIQAEHILSGKSTPDLGKTDLPLSGKATPDVARKASIPMSGQSTPKTGKASPDVHLTESQGKLTETVTNVTSSFDVSQLQSAHVFRELMEETITSSFEDKKSVNGDVIHEKHDTVKVETVKETHSGKSTPDLPKDSRKSSVLSGADESDYRKFSITSENTKTSSLVSGKSTPEEPKHSVQAFIDAERQIESTPSPSKSGRKTPEVAAGLPVLDPMSTSFYGALPDDDDDIAIHQHQHRQDLMTSSFIGQLPTDEQAEATVKSWGKPLGLPSPAPPNDNKGTPKKERRLPANVSVKNKLNQRSESPSKKKKIKPMYVDLTYVPHHGNSYYSQVDFFKRVRARYYVFSGIEPSREVYNALLEAKQTWDDKDLEVTIIPTYDTDVLGYWVAENEELLTKYKIDLSPSASRCTINLQDHETSCSAYRLEF